MDPWGVGGNFAIVFKKNRARPLLLAQKHMQGKHTNPFQML